MDGRLANSHGSPVEYQSNRLSFNTFSKHTNVSKHKIPEWPRLWLCLSVWLRKYRKFTLPQIINWLVLAHHDIHSPTRRKLIHEGSNIPSMGWTVVSLILMVHLLSICLTHSLLTLSAKIPKSVSTKPWTARLWLCLSVWLRKYRKFTLPQYSSFIKLTLAFLSA